MPSTMEALPAIVQIDSKAKVAKGKVDYDLKVKIVCEDVKSEAIQKLLNNLNKNFAGVK